MHRDLRRTVIGACTISLLLSMPLLHLLPRSHAATTSPWTSSNDLILTDLGPLLDGRVPPDSVNGNIDCSQQELTLRPSTLTQTAITAQGCLIHTAYGSVDTRSNAIQPFYADVAGPLSLFDGSGGFLGVPNSMVGMVVTGGGYLQINTNVIGKLKAAPNLLTGEVNYSLSSPPDFVLSDHTNHAITISYDSISFSANGRWMVVSSPGRALLRVDLKTFEILPFGPPFDYSTGIGPNPQTAITNDGRYVAAGSSSFRTFKLYDLKTCPSAPDTVSGPLSCQSRDIWTVLQAKINGFTTIGTVRFVDGDTLSLYAGYTATGNTQLSINKYNVSPGGSRYNQLTYLGMGDSYSSGEGAYSYVAGTDTDNNLCHLSAISYPYLIAKKLASNSFASVACSGATMDDILSSTEDYAGQVNDKIPLFNRDVDSILESFSPGYIDQIEFTSHYLPKSLTISISGNDIGFSDIIKECIANILHSTCYDSYEDRYELLQNINTQLIPLTNLYIQLKRVSAPGSRIYAIGYPQIVKPGGNCGLNVHLDQQELELASALVDQLNDMVRAAASSSGVPYIDVSEAFVGHRLCETVSSNMAVNGLTLGNDIPLWHGPIGNESYHPTPLGQQLLSIAVLAGTDNFKLAMPVRPTAATPTQAGQHKVLDKAVKTGRQIKTVVNKPILPKVIRAGQTYVAVIKGAQLGLTPMQQYNLIINQQVANSFQTTIESDLTVNITLSASTPAGYIVIEIAGQGISGQPITIHQIVYLQRSPVGALNNNAPSSQQGCQVVSSSGQDADQDSIDDACDGFISEPLGQTPTATSDAASLPLTTTINTGTMTTDPIVNDVASPTATVPTNNSKLAAQLPTSHQVLGATTFAMNPTTSVSSLAETEHNPQSFAKLHDLTKPLLILFITSSLVTVIICVVLKQRHKR